MAVLFGAVLIGCQAEPTKQSEPESTEEEKASQTQPIMPVPKQIEDELLSAEDVRDGATLKAQLIGEGSPARRLLVQGNGQFLCSPTGNCPYWIFRETPSGYEMEVDLGVAQSLNLQLNTTTTFPEIFARQHGSATSSELRIYQFDGTRYRLAKCQSSDYADPADLERILDEPLVTEFECSGNP
jgi:hypothetical protein